MWRTCSIRSLKAKLTCAAALYSAAATAAMVVFEGSAS
jgi:hypothetical protein